MKTARFASIVKTKGSPENYLAFTDPAKDHGFQSAAKAHRVLTVFQEAAGNKTDHGEVGYHPGHSRQFLIFPKSLKAYAGSKIVGIKYDVLDGAEEVNAARKRPALVIRRKKQAVAKPPKKATTKDTPSKTKVVPKPKRTEKTKRKPKPAKGTKPTHKTKILNFPAQASTASDIGDLKQAMRKAMAMLEDGKTVAAFNLLKKTVEDAP